MAEEANNSKSIGGDGVLLMDTTSGVVNTRDFDILLTDIRGETIRSIEIGGVKHLSMADDTGNSDPRKATTLNGITFGDYRRVLVMAVLSLKSTSVNTVLLVDTSSPFTFLTKETFKALGVNIEAQPQDEVLLLIHGRWLTAHLSKGHFEDVNVLGTNFLVLCELYVNYPFQTAQITIAGL